MRKKSSKALHVRGGRFDVAAEFNSKNQQHKNIRQTKNALSYQ